ncbi:hypothetical protein DL98DRAFT_565187 [Cadophora sp. DSE1049]|nr:hypothetical protein DL98DRAFT_565187 [Cadophora sp. DSE1049]
MAAHHNLRFSGRDGPSMRLSSDPVVVRRRVNKYAFDEQLCLSGPSHIFPIPFGGKQARSFESVNTVFRLSKCPFRNSLSHIRFWLQWGVQLAASNARLATMTSADCAKHWPGFGTTVNLSFEDIQVKRENDRFGQISVGEIHIKGPCVEVHTLRDLADSGKFSKTSTRKVSVRLDYSSVEPPQFELIILYSTGWSWEETIFYMLQVSPGENRPGCHNRRSLVEMESGEWELDVANMAIHCRLKVT